jgi:hypothetical protein
MARQPKLIASTPPNGISRLVIPPANSIAPAVVPDCVASLAHSMSAMDYAWLPSALTMLPCQSRKKTRFQIEAGWAMRQTVAAAVVAANAVTTTTGAVHCLHPSHTWRPAFRPLASS